MKRLDSWLNQMTMYALVQYGLLAVIVYAALLGFIGQLPYSGWAILIAATILASVCRLLNMLLAWLWQATPSVESATITGLILTLIVVPPKSLMDCLVLTLIAALAMTSKYILAFRRQHIFNPAAIALVIIGLAGSGKAIWWVATPILLPATAILGALVARKLQRVGFVVSCLVAAVATMAVVALVQGNFDLTIITSAFLSWPLVYFATIMVTEPATTPITKRWRYIYAVVIGGLFASQLRLGPIATTPEVALVAGNLLGLAVSGRRRVRLTLKQANSLAANIQEFVFTPDRPMPFAAGQYLEWALPHRRPDLRGSRRYFTIASSPTESELRIGIKLGPGRTSSFKTALAALKPGQWLTAAHAAGDFTLPTNASIKQVWIAGGIGVTPYRSMAKYLTDTKQRRDIHLIYLASSAEAFAYRDIFDQASQSVGIKVHYLVTPLTPKLLRELVPDWQEREYYISGPSGLVRLHQNSLRSAGIEASKIKVDDFPGF